MISGRQILDRLASGASDEMLSRLYCLPPGQTKRHKERLRQAVRRFTECFDHGESDQMVVCSAPGRTELGGNHTDHQGGKVLAGSVDLDALACAAPNGTAEIRVYSEGYGMISVDTGSPDPVAGEENTAAALVRGVAAGFLRRGCGVSGFDACIASEVPVGSGLSSSACFEVLLGVVMNTLFCGGKLDPVSIAMLGQYAENVYFGKPSGLLDQMACSVGGIIAIDFQDGAHPVFRPVPCNLVASGHALCIIDTGADHADLTADYAAIPREMRAVAEALGKDVLSQVAEAEFYAALPAIRRTVGDRAVLRAIHYFDDCARVDAQAAALERGDFAAFLRLVRASGRSSQALLQNISAGRDSAEQPVAVALAAAEHLLAGSGAVRVHGGGFAGTIQAYVPLEKLPAFQAGMDALLGEGACRVTRIRPVGGLALFA